MATPDMMAETWLGALACADGSQMCSGKMPAFTPKPTSASQNNGASSGMIAHRAEFPTAGARRQQREKGEQAQRAHVRSRKIKPAGRAHFAPLRVPA